MPVLYGDVPPYRDLDQGDEGRDVRQLEQNLWALGYRGFEVDGEFTYYTAVAVEEWQEDLGVEETGVLAMADVVVLDGPARVAAVTAGLGDAVAPGSADADGDRDDTGGDGRGRPRRPPAGRDRHRGGGDAARTARRRR